MPKFRKKPKIQLQENSRTDRTEGQMEEWTEGWADPILWDPSRYRRRSKKNKNLFILSDKV